MFVHVGCRHPSSIRTATLARAMSSTVDPRTRHVRTIDVASFVAELHASIGRVVIDVRTAEEFAQGHIHGAVLLDFRSLEFDRGLQQIGPNKKYAIYCRSGNRSGQAADAMRALGFGDVVDLDGGIVAYEAAGYSVVR